MSATELWAILGGVIGFVSVLCGIIWNMLQKKIDDNTEQLRTKAEAGRLDDMETKWHYELNSVREANEKLVNKLEVRHDKEIEQMSHRLGEQIKNVETNILNQLKLMFEMVKKD